MIRGKGGEPTVRSPSRGERTLRRKKKPRIVTIHPRKKKGVAPGKERRPGTPGVIRTTCGKGKGIYWRKDEG